MEKLLAIWAIVLSWLWPGQKQEIINPIVKNNTVTVIEVLPTPTPTIVVLPTPSNGASLRPIAKPTVDVGPWGVAKQVSEHTWTMKIEPDAVMGSPKEIMDALNEYRRRFGVAILMWDEKLAAYALSRSEFFVKNKGLDEHKGFINYLNNEDGFNKIGFTALGENSSYGYKMNGVHLIEWIYAGDKPHNDNQLNKDWAYVGIGTAGTATCLIFGTGKS